MLGADPLRSHCEDQVRSWIYRALKTMWMSAIITIQSSLIISWLSPKKNETSLVRHFSESCLLSWCILSVDPPDCLTHYTMAAKGREITPKHFVLPCPFLIPRMNGKARRECSQNGKNTYKYMERWVPFHLTNCPEVIFNERIWKELVIINKPYIA